MNGIFLFANEVISQRKAVDDDSVLKYFAKLN